MRTTSTNPVSLTIALAVFAAATLANVGRATAQPVPLDDRTGGVLVADLTLDAIFLTRDLNGDGDADDPGETNVYFDATNASGLATPTGNVVSIIQSADGYVYYADTSSDAVYRLQDANADGDALDAGEANIWFSHSGNAGGLTLPTPNGVAQDDSGAVYIVNAGTGTFPTDAVYRTIDLNADGDAEDAGEASIWFDLQLASAASSAFQIVFIGDTAYITDLVGGDPDAVFRARDDDASGAIGPGEFNVFIDETNAFGVTLGFAIVTDGTSIFVIDSSGVQAIFQLTDADASGDINDAGEVKEIWDETLVPIGFSLGSTFDMAIGPCRELSVTSSGATDADNVFRLRDVSGDGDFQDPGETIVWSNGGAGTGDFADGPRAAEYIIPPNGPKTFVETFDGGGNEGNWSYFGDPNNPVEVIEVAGGNPDAYLHSTCAGLDCLDTFAPQPRTQFGVASQFTGDYRARGVTSVGVDLILLDVDSNAGDRPLTVMLTNDGGTQGDPNDDLAVYFIGPDNVPEVGDGWQSFDFVVPADSAALPPCWVNFFPSGAGDDADWNTVITDVSQVSYFYGDPEFFFIFQQWEPGLDNARITTNGATGGDLNCDTFIDIDDVPAFAQALVDAAGYAMSHPCCDINRADVNGDGSVDGLDVEGFVAGLLGVCP